jgi:hypothetical protein
MNFFKIKNFYTSKCNELNCKTCKFIYDKNYIEFKETKIKLSLLTNANCNTSNIIYIIICIKCNLFYIGETKNSLKIRFIQHLNNIMKFIPFERYHDKVVPLHFRRNNHKISDIKICVFKSEFNNEKDRKEQELDLINLFNIKYKNCINKIISKNKTNFIFNI